jgi:hypothetical protein
MRRLGVARIIRAVAIDTTSSSVPATPLDNSCVVDIDEPAKLRHQAKRGSTLVSTWLDRRELEA